MVSSSRSCVLSIAGSDSGGGAGIQADIKTITALGGYAATAVTAITAQNTMGVHKIMPVAPEMVAAQIKAVLTDISVNSIKTGMLGETRLIETIAEALSEYATDLALIVDPVMVAASGDALLPKEAVDTIRAIMLAGNIITPNAPEAELLTGTTVQDVNGQRRAAERLLEQGAKAALIKGGHIDGDSITDVLADSHGEHILSAPRLASRNSHGTGCSLSAALALFLADGQDLLPATILARNWLRKALASSMPIGAGTGPVDHGWLFQYHHPDKQDLLNIINSTD